MIFYILYTYAYEPKLSSLLFLFDKILDLSLGPFASSFNQFWWHTHIYFRDSIGPSVGKKGIFPPQGASIIVEGTWNLTSHVFFSLRKHYVSPMLYLLHLRSWSLKIWLTVCLHSVSSLLWFFRKTLSFIS